MNNIVSRATIVSKKAASPKPIPWFFLIGTALLCFFFSFTLWPLVWHWVFLPHSQPDKHYFRTESNAPHRVANSTWFLDKPDSSLSAYVVWQVPEGGLYHLKLSCDDNGAIFIDRHPIISLEGVSALNAGVAKKWLTAGPHFLELRLHNGPAKGWLKFEVARPGRINYESLSSGELSYMEFGSITAWLKALYWGEYFCLLVFLGLSLFCLGYYFFRQRSERLFPTRRWNYFFIALVLLALTVSTLYHTLHPIPPIWSDGLGHYAYLPSYLIYHDVSLESLYQPSRRYDYPTHGLDLHDGDGFMRHPDTGRYILKYPIGTALLMTPFFLLGHLVSPLLGSTADGFSVVYQFAIALAAVFYMFAGLALLFKILIPFFSSKVVAITLLSLSLGTNLLAYASLEPSYSHIYSFFLVCALLYLVPFWYAASSRGRTVLLGVVVGLIPLVRNPNVLLLLIFPLYGITNWESAQERVWFLWQKKKRVLLLMAVAALVFCPQLLIWKITAGEFILKSYIYPIERFYFFSPHLLGVLFSPHHGLFIWSPILIFSVLGLWKMKDSLKSYRLPIVVCLLLHLYIVASWYVWFYGGVFGHRAFVDVLGLFALPLACFYNSFQKIVVRRVVGALATFLIALTFYLFCQSLLGVLPSGMRPYITWQVYKEALFDPSGMIYFNKWIKNPQVNYRLLK
jgi:hypothetical protein